MSSKLTDAERSAIASYKGKVTVCPPGQRATKWDEWFDDRHRPAGSKDRQRIDFVNRKRIVVPPDHSL